MHAAKLIGRYERWCDRAVPFDPDARAVKQRRMAASAFDLAPAAARFLADTEAFSGKFGAAALEHAARRMVSAVAADHAEFQGHVSADGHLRE